jgi:hypothetical protein
VALEAAAAEARAAASHGLGAGGGVWVPREVAQRWAGNGHGDGAPFPTPLLEQHAASLAAAVGAAEAKTVAVEKELAAATENFNVYRSRAHRCAHTLGFPLRLWSAHTSCAFAPCGGGGR